MDGLNGANIFTAEELEALFRDDDAQVTPPADGNTNTQDDGDNKNAEDTGNTQNNVETTKAFATRLKASTEKARQEEREAIAKSFGYDSYDAMLKARENKALEDKGLDPSIVSPVVEELVKQRIDNDPRMKELENFRTQQVQEFGKRELAEINKLTNGEITSLSQLPRDVIDLWAQKGSLKKAYLELEGEKLITKMRSEQSKGSTAHMATPGSGADVPTGKRLLTEEEKAVWRIFNPNMSEEELNKKTIDK